LQQLFNNIINNLEVITMNLSKDVENFDFIINSLEAQGIEYTDDISSITIPFTLDKAEALLNIFIAAMEQDLY